MNSLKTQEPIEGEDYYIAELRRYTICIEMCFDALDITDKSIIKSNAVVAFKDGSIDGNASIMASERMGEVELDFNTDLPFNRKAWGIKKLFELGLNAKGVPLRPFEKVRPKTERKIEDFGGGKQMGKNKISEQERGIQ